MPTEDPVLMEMTKTQLAGWGSGFAVVGVFISKAIDKIWTRISARDDANTAELIKLTKETNAALGAMTTAIVEMKTTLSMQIQQLVNATPKRTNDQQGA